MVEDGQDGGAGRPFTRIDAISGLHGQHRGEVEEDVVAAAGGLVRGAGAGKWSVRRTSSWLFDNRGASSMHTCPA